jgi:hypothetical protein
MRVGAKTEHGKEAGAKACPGTSSPDDAARRRFAALRAPPLDSWLYHRSRRSFIDDRRKTATLQLAGYLVLPFTALGDEEARMLTEAVAGR